MMACSPTAGYPPGGGNGAPTISSIRLTETTSGSVSGSVIP